MKQEKKDFIECCWIVENVTHPKCQGEQRMGTSAKSVPEVWFGCTSDEFQKHKDGEESNPKQILFIGTNYLQPTDKQNIRRLNIFVSLFFKKKMSKS